MTGRFSQKFDLDLVAGRRVANGAVPAGAYGAVEWTRDPQDLLNERTEYAVWRAGLDWLAGELETRTALAPRTAARPWLGERDDEPVRDRFGPGAAAVYDAADAAALSSSRATGRRRPIAGGRTYSRALAQPGKGAPEA